MTLGLSPVTGEVHWTVTGEGDGRSRSSRPPRTRRASRRSPEPGTRPTDGHARARVRPIGPAARHLDGDAPRCAPTPVEFRLPDDGYASVRLQQELERPRSGPPFARATVAGSSPTAAPRSTAWSTASRPTRAHGARARRRSSSPATGRPAWLAAPDPGPATPIAAHTRSGRRRTRPARAAPAARRPRRHRVRARGAAHAARRPRWSTRAGSRAAASRCSTRPTATRSTPPPPATARALAARCPRSRPRRRTPASAPASARSRCCTRAGCTRARSARCAAVGLVLPPALGPARVGLPALPPDLALRRHACCTPARPRRRSRSR